MPAWISHMPVVCWISLFLFQGWVPKRENHYKHLTSTTTKKKCSDEIWMLIPVSLSWLWQVVQPQGVVFCADRIVVKECRCLCARMRISLDILTWFSGQSCWICVIRSGAGWYYVITHYLQLLSTLPAQSLSVWSLIFFCIINKLQTCCFETQTSPNGNLFSSVVCLSASSFCFSLSWFPSL